MNPRLIAISGPAEGRVFPVRGKCFRIGRSAENELQLASVEVSRHHCELRRQEDGGFVVADLDSRHGVFLNGRPVRERPLAHSDLLSVGTSTLLFLVDDSSATAGDGDTKGPSAAPGSTLMRRATEILYLDRARVEAALPAQARIARDLYALLRAASGLQGPLELEEVARRLLEAVREVVAGERLAVLRAESGSEELTTLAVWSEDGGNETPLSAAPAFAAVVSERAGVLLESAPEEDTLEAAWLAAPLLDRHGEVGGVLLAETTSPQTFDERHLELLGALASIASPAFQNAQRLRELQLENRRLQSHQLDHDLVGESPVMKRLLELVARVARVDSTVLIRGESGTGKELVAQAIHRASERSGGPFVAINCATLSETLIESELFGHEKGAFTGAVARTIGKIEAAAGGTLFLDEVGEIPVGLQAKLLRVLQERSFLRVGGTRPIAADVRVLAATNRDLEAAIRDGRFREDLYYRLKVISLETPALRERPGDVPLLAQHFLELHGRRLGRRGVGLSRAARNCLVTYPWPGNVRELGNALERALVLGDTDLVQPEDLPDEVVEAAAEIPSSFQAALHELKERLILDALGRAGQDYAGAAAILGVHVNSLHRMIRRLGLKDRLER